jgi:hypothetical protein
MCGRFAGSRAAIVASGARAGSDARVVEGRRQPGSLAVAGIAGGGGLHMYSWFTGGGDAVAGGAGTRDHATVAKRGWNPGRGAVTGVARGGGLHMLGRFASGGVAVVTARAAAGDNAGVTETRTRPGHSRSMTLLARLCCLHMIGRFGRGGQAASL